MKRRLRQLIRLEIVLIYLVIIAGSVVRMTGSGMGCPDWPKCFGHLIPPTDREQVLWKPNSQFHKGRIIVRDEALLVANRDVRTGEQFDAANWDAYTKHDYAVFNALHTWIEYINRLLGALSGIPMLLIFLLSWWNMRKDLSSALLATLGLFLLGFEAWLGKMVVDGNLIPGQISIHMFGALSIVATLVALLRRQSRALPLPASSPKFAWILPVSIVLLLIQIYLGTQVREVVDTLEREGMIAREAMVEYIGQPFLIHRSFSWSLLILSLLFLWKNKGVGISRIHFGFVMLALAVGIILSNFGLPHALQPIHLLVATLFFGWLFHQSLKLWNQRKLGSPESEV